MKWPTPSAPASPTKSACAGRYQSLCHHIPEHASPIGAKRQPHADFPTALHRVRQYAIRARHGQQERQGGKHAQQLRDESRPANRLGDHIVHVAEPHDRKTGINAANDTFNGVGQGRRREGSVHVLHAAQGAAPGRIEMPLPSK